MMLCAKVFNGKCALFPGVYYRHFQRFFFSPQVKKGFERPNLTSFSLPEKKEKRKGEKKKEGVAYFQGTWQDKLLIAKPKPTEEEQRISTRSPSDRTKVLNKLGRAMRRDINSNEPPLPPQKHPWREKNRHAWNVAYVILFPLYAFPRASTYTHSVSHLIAFLPYR